MARRFTIVSGCSGGGKSTLLHALAAHGYATVEEPGRRIVAVERASGGPALPWVDPLGFAWRAVAMSRADLETAIQAKDAGLAGRVFFDRGLGDALAALEHCGAASPEAVEALEHFERTVFMLPPWFEIFRADDARKHGFDAAVAEYDRLCAFYPAHGFTVITVPKTSVAARVAFILAHGDRPDRAHKEKTPPASRRGSNLRITPEG